MRLPSVIPLLSLAILVPHGDAVHLPLSGRFTEPTALGHGLQRRTSAVTGAYSQLNDSQNMVYATNVTLNGQPFSIMIDTGSSDLWVSSSVPSAVPKNYEASVSYASGSASGNVMSATFDFAGFSIDSQYFIEAPDADAAAGADGLIGLGPSSGSTIRALVNSDAANPPLDRIFASNSSVPPYIAILLQRSDDPQDRYPGDLAVGEVLTDYQDILNQPRLPVTLTPLQGGQHWQTLLDVNGIIGPNGKLIEIKTQVTGAQTQNATVVFDSGFTLPQVPPYVAEALYSEIPGAVLTNNSNTGAIWTLPCDAEVNATFLFGGVEFPIHPLDLNFDGLDLTQDNGESICAGAFQPYSFDIEEDDGIHFDMILGMAFLRNSYMLINFGNLLNGAAPSTDTAYIQLLPITNTTQASQDFANVRNGGGDSSGQFGSTGSSASRVKLPLWLIVLIVGIALLVVTAGIACCRRRRTQNTSSRGTTWVATTPSYRPIHDPTPQTAYDMHMAPAPPGYTHHESGYARGY